MMEELDVEKARESGLWLRRVLVFSLLLALVGGLGGVLSIWMMGRAILFLLAAAIFVVLSILGLTLSAGIGAFVGGALSDWADLDDVLQGVFGFLFFVAYVVGYVLFIIFVLPGWGDALASWGRAGVH